MNLNIIQPIQQRQRQTGFDTFMIADSRSSVTEARFHPPLRNIESLFSARTSQTIAESYLSILRRAR